MKNCLILFIILLPTISFSQTDTIARYYNKDWDSCGKDAAAYYSNIFKVGENWKRIDYYVTTKTPKMIGFYTDSSTKNENGIFKYFDEKGNLTIQAIMVWDGNKSHQQEYSSFYPDGKIQGKLIRNNRDSILINEMYAENGEKIKDAIFYQEPAYPGGAEGWGRYLSKNLNADTPVKNNAPPGKYVVTLTFLVEKDGNITDIKTLNNPGYGTQEEAIRIIARSGKWQPAILKNKLADYRFTQRIIFVVSQ